MKKALPLVWIVLAIGSLVLQGAGGKAQAGGGEKLFKFKQLVGVSGVFRGTTTPLRTVPGGGAPWVIDAGTASLKENGELSVVVHGVVIAPSFGPPFGGTNPVPRFFATLSCLNPTTGMVDNLNTETVVATSQGDATIKAVLNLPDTCVAPIVLVRGDLSSIPNNPFSNQPGPDAADPWFAASGF